ncbi:HAAS signaling domain-containing protein [Paenibacillus senegalimassiliensis]|uniref:HAAS signaling domain-containing protein n=1 Tax=Paenibacillus senegalimassiliensis TaxID=1737426 RepID=UPI00073E467E|nr:DUF1700 domain-containing protein [Paenibacillus senegalimassiliensis]
MNRSEFLALLRVHLSPLPPEEQQELLEDYQNHFAFGLQSGRSEEEIVAELGDPAELAKEALGNRYVPDEPIYWYGGPNQTSEQQASSATGMSNRPIPIARRNPFTQALVYIGLFFLNIVGLPFLLTLWCLVVSLGLATLSFILSPLLVGLEYAVHDNFHWGKLFASVTMVGLGILISLPARMLLKTMLALSVSYFKWNKRLVKGDAGHEQQ